MLKKKHSNIIKLKTRSHLDNKGPAASSMLDKFFIKIRLVSYLYQFSRFSGGLASSFVI